MTRNEYDLEILRVLKQIAASLKYLEDNTPRLV